MPTPCSSRRSKERRKARGITWPSAIGASISRVAVKEKFGTVYLLPRSRLGWEEERGLGQGSDQMCFNQNRHDVLVESKALQNNRKELPDQKLVWKETKRNKNQTMLPPIDPSFR